MSAEASGASFRDPSGFIFHRAGGLFRQVNEAYRPHFDHLIDSRLYAELSADGLLVRHVERPLEEALTEKAYRVLEPERVPFVSFPYEWSFSQLRDAALLTLEVQLRALERGMVLKDASAFNVQFIDLQPILIDTLSFEVYEEGSPWIAYRQFCQHFLAPLLLAGTVDPRLGRLSALYLDGVPLELATELLPWTSRLRPSRLLHVHLHARSLRRHARISVERSHRASTLTRQRLVALVESLRNTVRGLTLSRRATEWTGYEQEHGYGAAMQEKRRIVDRLLRRISPESVWDLGANVGAFSRIAAAQGARVVSMDMDAVVVDRMYRVLRSEGEGRVLPLVLDVTNPSPALGWAGAERESLAGRGPADAVLALALLHHLAISNNVPIGRIAEWLSTLAPWLIIEFVPKSDPRVRRLLLSRKDIFGDYRGEVFEREFGRWYRIEARERIEGTEREVYLMKRIERGIS